MCFQAPLPIGFTPEKLVHFTLIVKPPGNDNRVDLAKAVFPYKGGKKSKQGNWDKLITLVRTAVYRVSF